ncbi:transposase [Nocardia nova]|uniref:transposase n=1 Tax=Nocardia nova TaxID=37330 RepID=UPI00378BD34E
MSLGRVPGQGDLLRSTVEFCVGRVADDSIYGVLHRECGRLFPDEVFADLFTDIGRRSVPPMIVAVVMVLQRFEGLSDREAVERLGSTPGGSTQLVDWISTIRDSCTPFWWTCARGWLARIGRIVSSMPCWRWRARPGWWVVVGCWIRRRCMTRWPRWTPSPLVRSAIRGLLAAAGAELAARLRALAGSGDDYASAAKPGIDWDDETARNQLIDSRARDGMAMLALLDGCELDEQVGKAAALLATVLGQDIGEDADGHFAIVRGTATDRVISTVDPETRHGRKTSARGFDGYKGHIAVDPDSEIITVTPANSGDAEVAEELLADILPAEAEAEAGVRDNDAAVFGDAAYGAGELLKRLDDNGIRNLIKVQPSPSVKGHFSKDRFTIDLNTRTVRCPSGVTAPIAARIGRHTGVACFGDACASCPLRTQCTTAASGRTITIGAYEHYLATARERRDDPVWKADYRGTRPKVERKIGHLMRRRHGGRRARMRGQVKIGADFGLLAAAVKLARLAVLGIGHTTSGWTAARA